MQKLLSKDAASIWVQTLPSNILEKTAFQGCSPCSQSSELLKRTKLEGYIALKPNGAWGLLVPVGAVGLVSVEPAEPVEPVGPAGHFPKEAPPALEQQRRTLRKYECVLWSRRQQYFLYFHPNPPSFGANGKTTRRLALWTFGREMSSKHSGPAENELFQATTILYRNITYLKYIYIYI